MIEEKDPMLPFDPVCPILYFPDELLTNCALPHLYTTDFYNILMSQEVKSKPVESTTWQFFQIQMIDIFNANHRTISDPTGIRRKIIRDTKCQMYFDKIRSQRCLNGTWVPTDVIAEEFSFAPDTISRDIVRCQTCKDYAGHADSSHLCSPKDDTMLLAYKDTMPLQSVFFGTISGVWVAAKKGKHSLKPTTKHYILNASLKDETVSSATHLYFGNEAMYYKAYRIKFTNWFDHVRTVAARMPRDSLIPVFIEFLDSPMKLRTTTAMFLAAIAHFNMIAKLREKYSCPFVTIGPFPHYTQGMTKTERHFECDRVMYLSNILTIVAAKCSFIFIPLTMAVFTVKHVEFPDLYFYKGNYYNNELLSNPNGTATRERNRRLGFLIDSMLEAVNTATYQTPMVNLYFKNINGSNKHFHCPFETTHTIDTDLMPSHIFVPST